MKRQVTGYLPSQKGWYMNVTNKSRGRVRASSPSALKKELSELSKLGLVKKGIKSRRKSRSRSRSKDGKRKLGYKKKSKSKKRKSRSKKH